MDWNKLVERCQLFEPGVPKPLLEELLKEGEISLCRMTSILERKLYMVGPFTTISGTEANNIIQTIETKNEWANLPQDFSRMKYVYINGRQIPPIQQNDCHRDANNNLDSGTPQGYYVHNDRIYFDKIPGSDYVLLEYFAELTTKNRGKNFTINASSTIEYDGDDWIVRDPSVVYKASADRGGLVESKTKDVVHIVRSDIADPDTMIPNNPISPKSYYGFAIDTDLSGVLNKQKIYYQDSLNIIEIVGELANPVGRFFYSDGPLPTIGEIVQFPEWRDFAPVIPTQYQTDLCYYALNIATGNDSYLQKWMAFTQVIEEQDISRDLNHNIKGVV